MTQNGQWQLLRYYSLDRGDGYINNLGGCYSRCYANCGRSADRPDALIASIVNVLTGYQATELVRMYTTLRDTTATFYTIPRI